MTYGPSTIDAMRWQIERGDIREAMRTLEKYRERYDGEDPAGLDELMAAVDGEIPGPPHAVTVEDEDRECAYRGKRMHDGESKMHKQCAADLNAEWEMERRRDERMLAEIFKSNRKELDNGRIQEGESRTGSD